MANALRKRRSTPSLWRWSATNLHQICAFHSVGRCSLVHACAWTCFFPTLTRPSSTTPDAVSSYPRQTITLCLASLSIVVMHGRISNMAFDFRLERSRRNTPFEYVRIGF